MEILLSTHQVLERASQQILWLGGPAVAQRLRAGRPRTADGYTSSLEGCCCWKWLWFAQELLRWKEDLYMLCWTQLGFILPAITYRPPLLLLHATQQTHTHTFFRPQQPISDVHGPILSNCDKSTGSHRWIIGSIKRQVPWPMLQGHSHVLTAPRLDWLFYWLCKWDRSRCFGCHSREHPMGEQVEKLGSQMTNVFMPPVD